MRPSIAHSPYSSVTWPVSFVPDWLIVMFTPTWPSGVTNSTRHSPAALGCCFCCASGAAQTTIDASSAAGIVRPMRAILLPRREFRMPKDVAEHGRAIRRSRAGERCTVGGQEARDDEAGGGRVDRGLHDTAIACGHGLALPRLGRLGGRVGMLHERRREVARAAGDPRPLDAALAGRDRVPLEIRQPIAGAQRELMRQLREPPRFAAADAAGHHRVAPEQTSAARNAQIETLIEPRAGERN